MKKEIIALIGAGSGGEAILSNLLEIPGICIKYVCDLNSDSPGMVLARKNNVLNCLTDWSKEIANDHEIDLIFEVTGDEEVFNYINSIKSPDSTLIGSSATKIIFHLLENQHKIMHQLEAYKNGLELKIIEGTEKIEQANEQLQSKILEYERLNEKLQKINNEKTKYLLQSTHQLKAPFAAIQSYTDILLDGYAGEINENTSQILLKIKKRCKLLTISIQEMLELANLKSCIQENINMELENLSKIVNEVVESHLPTAENKKIKINFSSEAPDAKIKCNRDQLKILFSILIDNAINYSHENSEIDISIINVNKDKLNVSISDYGIGIPQESISKIFGEYFRTNIAVSQHNNGTGLGLSIAKEIANLHNTFIDVTSEEGNGSTFKLSFSKIE